MGQEVPVEGETEQFEPYLGPPGETETIFPRWAGAAETLCAVGWGGAAGSPASKAGQPLG